MTTESNASDSAAEVRTERRYWRRADSPRSWWPWGLLPSLGLVLLFLYGMFYTAPRVEANVESRVQARLNDADFTASEVRSDGQGVTIDIAAPATDRMYIHALAKSTQCDTWAGPMTCPTNVAVRLETPTAPMPAAVIRRPHDFTFVKSESGVTLNGEVPDQAQHEQILDIAGKTFPRVNDRLSISNEAATDKFPLAAEQALAVVSPLVQGQAKWTNTVLSASGIASTADADAARKQFDAMNDASALGSFDVRLTEESGRCNEKFSEALTSSTIRFRTASAIIDDGNETLLERLAQLAQECPGDLTIEGHTDSMGDADMNQALSLARASAVRDALAKLGVGVQRLQAKGVGELQPIADNASAAGRSKNRRIVIAINEETIDDQN